MNNISTDCIPSENTTVTNSQAQVENYLPLLPSLPRSAWSSQVVFLRTLFRVKKALDKIEEESRVLRA